MWKEDGTAPTFVQALQDMLEEGIVRASLWRCAEEVAAPRITGPCLTVPLLDGIRWVCQHYIERCETTLFIREGRSFERIPTGNGKILHAMQSQVHAGDGGGH